MAIDEERGILFLHIPKNAGKSIELAMGLVDEDELTHYAFRSPLNRAATFLQRATKDRQAPKRLFGTVDVSLCAQHLTLMELQLLGLVAPEKIESYFKFAVCRNPFDRLISTYFHFSNPNERQSLEKFCETWFSSPTKDHNILAHRRQQCDFVRGTDGNICIDEFLRFESLHTEFADKIRSRFEHVSSLPEIGRRTDRVDYRELHTPQTIRFVEENFGNDLELFGYEF